MRKLLYNENWVSYYSALATSKCVHVFGLLKSNLPLCLLLTENIKIR